ncbi:MAG: OB-fold nucleic acid binding domain-containing protein, partial [Pirellulales bacterium]|nr:OB-fold nucleic acid binding domain-containing protein [Pirellulales bacterium]
TVVDGKISFGLTAIKGCGIPAAEAIKKSRASEGQFGNLFDFCSRIDPSQVNRSTIETLVKAGAFDSFGAKRAQVMAVVDRAMTAGAGALADRKSGQMNMFDMDDGDDAPDASVDLPNIPEWSEKEKLPFEKEVLGFYLSSHPLAEFAETLKTFCSHRSTQLGELKHRDEVLVGGMLAAIKFSNTKKPKPGSTHTKYAMWDLEDLDGIVRCILWPEQFAQYGELVAPDAIVAIRATVDRRPGADEVNLICNELIPIELLPQQMTSGLRIRVDEEAHGVRGLEQLYEILRGYPGKCSVQLVLDLADGQRVEMNSEGVRVTMNEEMRTRVDQLLGPGNVKLAASKKNGNGQGRVPTRGPARAASVGV